jgi:hypothetical protein
MKKILPIIIILLVIIAIAFTIFFFVNKKEYVKVEKLVNKQEQWLFKVEDISSEQKSNSLIVYENYIYNINDTDGKLITESKINYDKDLNVFVEKIKAYAKEDIDNGKNYKITFKDNTYKYISIDNTKEMQEFLNTISSDNIFKITK